MTAGNEATWARTAGATEAALAEEVLARLAGYRPPRTGGVREQDRDYLARVLQAVTRAALDDHART